MLKKKLSKYNYLEHYKTDLKEVPVCMLSHVWLFATPWTVAQQAPLSMGFSRQEYWSRLPFPSPGDLPDPGIKPASPALAGVFFTHEPPGKSLKRWPKLIHIFDLLTSILLKKNKQENLQSIIKCIHRIEKPFGPRDNWQV